MKLEKIVPWKQTPEYKSITCLIGNTGHVHTLSSMYTKGKHDFEKIGIKFILDYMYSGWENYPRVCSDD